MIDSQVVLNGQTIAYTCYCIAILLLMGWFAIQVTKKGKGNKVKPALFYSFVGMLIVRRLGVGGVSSEAGDEHQHNCHTQQADK